MYAVRSLARHHGTQPMFVSVPQPAWVHMRSTRGFTLVELLVVIAIIGTLIGLLLPAVQAAREAGRRTACGNNLRQLALASIQHESQHKFFPSGGWGWIWTGDPDRGFGKSQPGSWAYSLLPNLEYAEIFNKGADGQADVVTDQQRTGVASVAGVPVATFICPSRRAARAYPLLVTDPALFANAVPSTRGSRSDYAANAGANQIPWFSGPADMQSALAGAFGDMSGCNGLAHQRSEVRPVMITDGLSKTYLMGEKYLDPRHYDTGQSIRDDQSMLAGDDLDMHAWTHVRPLRDTQGFNGIMEFGSAHPSGLWMAFVDGSVRTVSFDVDGTVHSRAGSRNDGAVSDVP